MKFDARLPYVALLTAAALMSAPGATAQEKMTVNMAKVTCGELAKAHFEDFVGITMWMSGYYNATLRNTVVDLTEYARAAARVKAYCQKNPSATAMSSAERVLGIKMPRQ